jgi:hypothetical protein
MKTKSKPAILGFGFCPDATDHCFVVTLPASQARDAEVLISEHFHWNPKDDKKVDVSFNDQDAQLKVVLTRAVWSQIEDDLKAEFNRRLQDMGVKTGRWLKKGQVPVERSLGKEMTLLAWAIEDADPALVPTAIRNWLGLAPEERWWLYTMTNAATGAAIAGKKKGWRKAVRFALTENPVVEGALKQKLNDFNLGIFARR